ncbi:MAG: metallophosphoesterase [Acidobacteriota bacterium]
MSLTTGSSAPADIRYLFRFRDLIAKTIQEHQQIIDKYQASWWGWWKRPTEGSRPDVWEPLEAETLTGREVTIGLFDSGDGSVHQARVSRVIKPQPDTGLPPLPKGEETLVPEYYRKSPFSRAWMKIVKIDPQPFPFFGRYSFGPLPPLPYYSQSVLNRLRDKVIISPDELRGMDTTIWEVRPKASGDHETEILLSTRSLSTPVSFDSVDAQSNTILHITDPHFTIGKHRSQHVWRLESEVSQGKATLAEAIKDALNETKVGLIIVTGDLTFTGETVEFDEARTSLIRLLGLLDLDLDRLVVVPGNHDIRWTQQKPYNENASVLEAPDEARKNYRKFYFDLYRHDPNPTLSMGRRFQLPCGVALEVCALNSSSLEQGKKFLAGMGRIEESALNKVANELRWDQPSLALRMLALHHHLVATENVEPASGYNRGFGIAVDAPKIMRRAAKYGVHLALHGHKHRVFIWRSGVYELPEHTQTAWQLGNVSIVGGGSAGSTDTEARKNYFNLVDVSNSGVSVRMYRAEDGGAFSEMARWTAALELKGSPPSLTLQDWIIP